jgi:two-component system nitrate/nitrite response regulator NarL
MAGLLLRRLAALSAARLPGPSVPRLTNREREVVRLLGQNLSNKEIATRLGVEVATAKNHVHNLLEKLNVHRRSDVARLNPS